MSEAGKRRWGDKTPGYATEIARIHRLFPEARFLHLIRDGRDVVSSLRKTGWHGEMSWTIAEYWATAVSTARREGRALPPGQYWDLTRSVLVEKSPPTIIRARFFQALFPEQSYFVLLMRHPISVSYSTGRWTKQPLDELIDHWLVLHETFEDSQRAALKRLLVVRYEDFCREPQRVAERVWEFAGLEPVPLKRTVRQGIDQKYFRRWHRSGWTPWGHRNRKSIIERFEDRLRALNYDYSLLEAP